ncbi:type 2 isopentenyl-diphosphate Delta-isomerase [Nocardia sp. NBC_00511]|uniref:type 2 isopentenyl-diphosphate Delta-isomerase n=1 Tax=Nocardia sp. NBC_00511 TaxID=2903591 RepID=UPI0030E10773
MTASRKDDHVRLASEQWRQPTTANEFDDVAFVHHALAGIDRSDVSLGVEFAGIRWGTPLYINAMTGGSELTGKINRELAIAARETGLAIAAGSLSAYLKDESCADTFRVIRKEHPDGFVMANINARTRVADARRVIDLLEADALQIHLNAVQEIVMPEGDREFASWAGQIERIRTAVDVPVIVKEVGFGLSGETACRLAELGVDAIDVGGRGGTDFAAIENGRRDDADFAYLAGWGQSTPAALLDCAGATNLPILASGGVRTPLDVVRGLALGATAVGSSGCFLKTVLDGGPDALVRHISTWLDRITVLLTVLGARTPSDCVRCDLVLTGTLRAFCEARGIDVRGYGHRA